MSAAWVAGSVRAQAMARRRLGTAGARALAAGPLADAMVALTRSPYGDRVHPGDDVAAVGRAIAETVLWNLRVLAGWLPGGGTQILRLLGAWFEIANVDAHLRSMGGETVDSPYRLGALATSWPTLRLAASPDELQTALSHSPWGDPGSTTVRDVHLAMGLAWADRVAAHIVPARVWAAGAAALVVAREHFALGRPLNAEAVASAGRVLGPAAVQAESFDGYVEALPARGRWVLDGIAQPRELWRAEATWWRRVRVDGTSLVAAAAFGADRVVGAAALLAADAWLVRAAVEASARGAPALEVFDAVA